MRHKTWANREEHLLKNIRTWVLQLTSHMTVCLLKTWWSESHVSINISWSVWWYTVLLSSRNSLLVLLTVSGLQETHSLCYLQPAGYLMVESLWGSSYVSACRYKSNMALLWCCSDWCKSHSTRRIYLWRARNALYGMSIFLSPPQ